MIQSLQKTRCWNKDTKDSERKNEYQNYRRLSKYGCSTFYRKIWTKDRNMEWQVANGEDIDPVFRRKDHLIK